MPETIMGSTINLSFRYTQRDIMRAIRAHYADHLRLWLDIPVVILLGAFAVFLWPSPELHWMVVVLAVADATFAAMLVAVFTIVPFLAFRSQPKYREDYSLTFSPEGIHFRTAHINSRLEWSLYSRALVDAQSYVLYYGTRAFTIVPRRVLEDAAQRASFERLLEKNIPKIVRKGS